MTKYLKYILLLAALVITALLFLKKDPHKSRPSSTEEIPQVEKRPNTNVEKQTLDNKKVMGLKPEKVKEQLEKLKTSDTASESWEINLEKNLLEQGGDSIKSIDIKKVDSFIWKQDSLALHVESVVVTIKNQQNAESSFRAMVDAQTGKILKTWDQPVFDPAHPKDNFKIKIDTRYHQPQ